MKKTQPTVRWEKYILNPQGEYLDYLSNYGNKFLQGITTNLIDAHLSKSPNHILFTFRNSNIVCKLNYNQYTFVLKKIMSLCERLEYYEVCAQIVKHFKTLQQKDRQLHKFKLIKNAKQH